MTKQDMIYEIAKLRSALKPFASAARSLDEDHGDGLHLHQSPACLTICAADLRRAAMALQE